MDEVQQLLKAILARTEENSAELKGLRLQVSGLEARMGGLEAKVDELRRDTNERLEAIEERLDYFAEKWMEHDQEIVKLKRRRG